MKPSKRNEFEELYNKDHISAVIKLLLDKTDEIEQEYDTNELFKSKKEFFEHQSFYRYCTPSSFNFEALKNDTLYLSNSCDFNDPFDGYFGVNCSDIISRKLCEKILNFSPIS